MAGARRARKKAKAPKSEVIGSYTGIDLFNEYADEVTSKKKGWKSELCRLEVFKKAPFAKKRLTSWRRETDIEPWIKARLKAVCGSTVNRELNLLSHCLTKAHRWRWIAHNPLEDLERPKNSRERERLIDDDEIEAYLQAARYSEDAPVVLQRQKTAWALLFAIETGMRMGEICAMERRNVDYKGRSVFVPDSKNGRSRFVPLSKEAIRLLKRLPDAGNSVLGMSARNMATISWEIIAETGIENLTFHDSRHEAATRMAPKLHVLDLPIVFGWRNVNQALTYYNRKASELAPLLD